MTLPDFMNRYQVDNGDSNQQPERHSKMPVMGVGAKDSPCWTAPIIGPIGDIADYYGLLSLLEFADAQTTVRIIIDSPGGRVDTAAVIANAIAQSKASVIGVANGQVMSSASTLIFPACKKWEIRAGAKFMFHGTIQGQQGKSMTIRDSTITVIEYIKQQLTRVAELGILTSEEVDKIMGTKGTVFLLGSVVKARMQQKGIAVS
jgi:ATP-dependent protease ClpP protease subunit